MMRSNKLLKFIVIFYFTGIPIVEIAQAFDYCSPKLCRLGVKHVACGQTNKFVSTCPNDAEMVVVDDSLKNIILCAYNGKRDYIAGGHDRNHDPACRMATMQWNNELAILAAHNVRQCKIAHDKCRNTETFRFSGQNLAWMGYFGTANHTQQFVRAIDLWYNEVSNSSRSLIRAYPKNYKGPTIGHFTVMMADRNIQVGCAAATYAVNGVSYRAYLVACNYATTNMINFPIYASCPKSAEQCSTGTNPLYSNLCSTSEVYAVNKWF